MSGPWATLELFRCANCGEVMTDPPTAPERCECGGQFWRFVRADQVPSQELESLVERWYDRADEFREEGLNADYHATRQCADELAKTLEEDA